MKEEFLHYVWQYKKFDFSNLTTINGERLTILNFGSYLEQSGPDFFSAKIIIDNQIWGGNVEMHVKSSDWYLHGHEKDENYDNVILHVVWEHNMPVFRKDNSEIPVLEIRKYIPDELLGNYISLSRPKTWINCENQIHAVDGFIITNWLERLFFERLERKSIPVEKLLTETKSDWEAVLFCMLAKNFGLNTNGEIFFKTAQFIPFTVIRKERSEVMNLESLFFGMISLIPEEAQDNYTKELKKRFTYLSVKHGLKEMGLGEVEFFRHRPDNFPTIRLAQLAMLYHKEENLFSKVIEIDNIETLFRIFSVIISGYWQTHYQFDKESPKKLKQISKPFFDLLVINTIIPIKFAFAKSQGKDISESLLNLIKDVAPEKNAIIEKFAVCKLKSGNAFETQSLLQLKNEYCNKSKCLQCAIGIQLLKE